MKNPFVYGETVSGDNFCDRAREMKELIADIKNGQNVKKIVEKGTDSTRKRQLYNLWSVFQKMDQAYLVTDNVRLRH